MKNQRYLSQENATILYQLAEHRLRLDGTESEAAEELSDIVSTANRLPESSKRKDIVQLGSNVAIHSLGAALDSRVTLVHPSEANPAEGRISVLTPIGLAILGRKAGATIEVDLPSGRQDKIRIVEIHANAEEAEWNAAS